MTRADVIDIIKSLFRFVEVKSSKLDSSKNVVLCVQGASDDSSATDSEICGFGPLQFKPENGTDAMVLELGDERRVISIKNRNWSISIGNGEVILQALGGTTPAYLHMKPNGEVTINSSAVKIGAVTAAQAMVLGNQLQTILGALTVPTAMGPSGTPINAANFPNFLSTKHDVDS